MTPIAIAVVQVLYLTILYRPLGWHRLGLTRGMRIGLGYLLSNALALCVAYALNMASAFTPSLTFTIWLAIGGLLNVLVRPDKSLFPSHLRAVSRITLMLMGVILYGALIRLAEPMNAALAGTDCYQFLNFYVWLSCKQQAIHDYPSGFAVVTSITPWAVRPYDAVRWAPHLVFLGCQAAAFGFWQRLGGLRFALSFTFLLSTTWCLYPITAYHPHFIQWTMVFVGLPALLALYARLGKGSPIMPTLLVGLPVNLALAMTSAYFALYLNLTLLILTLLVLPKNRTALKPALAAASMALVAPLTLLLYYGILARHFFPYWSTGISTQSQAVTASSGQIIEAVVPAGGPLPAPSLLDHPLLRIIETFLTPVLSPTIWERGVIYVALFVLGVRLWCRLRSRRHIGIRLLAGLMLLSVFSATTGIFELPAWQGRNVFISLYAAVALTVWIAFHHFPARIRRLLHSQPLVVMGVLMLAGPSLLSPPVIGHNVPITSAIRPRDIPADNQVLTELLRTNDGVKKRLVVVSPYGSPSPLVSNILRLHYPHPRELAFPEYHVIKARTVSNIREPDALLIPANLVTNAPVPDACVIHTTGKNYVFFMREALLPSP